MFIYVYLVVLEFPLSLVLLCLLNQSLCKALLDLRILLQNPQHGVVISAWPRDTYGMRARDFWICLLQRFFGERNQETR